LPWLKGGRDKSAKDNPVQTAISPASGFGVHGKSIYLRIIPLASLKNCATKRKEVMSDHKYILIGEDDTDDQELLRDIFADIDENYKLIFVNNGAGVLAYLESQDDDNLPCLILLDYNMPGMNGADILVEMNGQTRYSGIPRIIWSTSGADKYQKICRDLGAVDYVIKPANIRDLEKIARYMLSVCNV
jgi:CheY-like chemotaxis protein